MYVVMFSIYEEKYQNKNHTCRKYVEVFDRKTEVNITIIAFTLIINIASKKKRL